MSKRGSISKWETHVKDRLETIRAWSRDGLSKEQIANNLHVSVSSLMKYQVDHPELLIALKDGLSDHIAEVENAQAKAALGYEVEETRIVYDVDDNGRPSKVARIEKTKKVIGPNITAGIFILKNRAPQKWRDAHHVNVHDANKLSEYTEDELKDALKEME